MMNIRIPLNLAILFAAILMTCTNPANKNNTEHLNARLSEVINDNAKIIKLAGGFQFTEGPAWNKADNYLLFSDIPANTIYKWTNQDSISVDEQPSGNTNGLAFDDQ
ncbi:MAG: SMP-30/gluconolactonase/LRE family protein, partial [Cyclobacteriaceae bacterium]